MLFSLPLFSIAAMHELTKMGTEVLCLSHRCPMWQPNTLSESLIEKCYSILKCMFNNLNTSVVQRLHSASLFKPVQHHFGFCRKLKSSKFNTEQEELFQSIIKYSWVFMAICEQASSLLSSRE